MEEVLFFLHSIEVNLCFHGSKYSKGNKVVDPVRAAKEEGVRND